MRTGSRNGGAGAVSGDGEFVILGLPVFLRCLKTSFDTVFTIHMSSQ